MTQLHVCLLAITWKESKFEAFFFETKGVTKSSVGETDFEFVLVDAPDLYNVEADDKDFREHLSSGRRDGKYGCTFPNLLGDATLVAPRKLLTEKPSKSAYGHFAAFVRRAPDEQIRRVFQLAIQTYNERLESSKVTWLSTCGTSVPWLHLRLDSKPKWYSYEPFKKVDIIGNASSASELHTGRIICIPEKFGA